MDCRCARKRPGPRGWAADLPPKSENQNEKWRQTPCLPAGQHKRPSGIDRSTGRRAKPSSPGRGSIHPWPPTFQTIFVGASSDAACAVELIMHMAEPAAGSIATDRAITMARIVRKKRIAVYPPPSPYRMCGSSRQFPWAGTNYLFWHMLLIWRKLLGHFPRSL